MHFEFKIKLALSILGREWQGVAGSSGEEPGKQTSRIEGHILNINY